MTTVGVWLLSVVVPAAVISRSWSAGEFGNPCMSARNKWMVIKTAGRIKSRTTQCCMPRESGLSPKWNLHVTLSIVIMCLYVLVYIFFVRVLVFFSLVLGV